MTYNKEFDIPEGSFNFAKDLEFGHSGEEFVKRFYESVIQGAAEIKTDRYRNGRMVIETEQNPRRRVDEHGVPIWQLSGINVTTAAWWIYVYSLNEAMTIISVPRLKRFLRANIATGAIRKEEFAKNSDNPARGFLLMPEQVMEMLYSEKYD